MVLAASPSPFSTSTNATVCFRASDSTEDRNRGIGFATLTSSGCNVMDARKITMFSLIPRRSTSIFRLSFRTLVTPPLKLPEAEDDSRVSIGRVKNARALVSLRDSGAIRGSPKLITCTELITPAPSTGSKPIARGMTLRRD